jgi:hypothetical protein
MRSAFVHFRARLLCSLIWALNKVNAAGVKQVFSSPIPAMLEPFFFVGRGLHFSLRRRREQRVRSTFNFCFRAFFNGVSEVLFVVDTGRNMPLETGEFGSAGQVSESNDPVANGMSSRAEQHTNSINELICCTPC